MSASQRLTAEQENEHLQKLLPPLLGELNQKLDKLKIKARGKKLTDERTMNKINSLEIIIDGIRHAGQQPEGQPGARLSDIRAYLTLAHAELEGDRKPSLMKSAKMHIKNYTVDILKKQIEVIDAVLPSDSRIKTTSNHLLEYYNGRLQAMQATRLSEIAASDIAIEEKLARLTTPKTGFFREAYRSAKAHIVRDESRKQAIKEGREAVGEFTQEIKALFDQRSENNDGFINFAAKEMAKLNNGKEFGKMMGYLLDKGEAGKKVAKQLIKHYIDASNKTKQKNDKLDRCLMIAAKIGDSQLCDDVIIAGGEMIREKKLVVDENNCNVLHYACQSDNAHLVKFMATSMRRRAGAEKGELIPPKDSISPVTKQFDPFRIPDDPSCLHRNTLRPIHFLSQAMAYQLDVEYKLPLDGSPGTFTAAYNLFRIENRNTARGFLDWAKLKTASYGEVVADTALSAKVNAAVGVAKISDEVQAHMGNSLSATISTNVASGMIITGAALAGTGFVANTERKIKQTAKEAMGAYEFVALPDLDTGKIPSIESKNLLDALKVHNIGQIKSFINARGNGFDTTTLELIKAVKKIEFSENENDQSLRKSIYRLLINKINCGFIRSESPLKLINTIFDSLYRRETEIDNKLAESLLEHAGDVNTLTPEVKEELKKWKEKFQVQKARIDFPDPSEPVQTTPPGNHELIEAFENYDFYKIRHIITHGEFNYTSKKVIHALQEMYTFPVDLKAKSSLSSDVQSQTFMQLLFEGLAKKAGPKQFMELFDNLIHRGQAETAKQIIRNLIKLYSKSIDETKNADCERLKMLALQAAGLGDLESLKQALSVLRNDPHNLSTLKIMDHQGNNILHYAAQAQNAEIIEYMSPIMSHDFDVVSGKIAADKRGFFDEGMLHDLAEWGKQKLPEKSLKQREGTYHKATGETEYLKTAKKIEHIFQIPNRNGLTPFRLLRNKDTVARLDRFFGTVGFRMDANEYRNMQRANEENTAINRAQWTVIIGMLIGSCAAFIPGAIAYGSVVGAAIAAKIGAGASVAGVLGGGAGDAVAAATLALTTEHGLMPAFDKLGRYLHDQWGKMFNGTSMEGLRDFDNRILSKSDQLISILANNIYVKHPDKSTEEFIAQTIQSFIEAESDPTMKAIAGFAAINAAKRFNKMQLPTEEFDPAKDSVTKAYDMLGIPANVQGDREALKGELLKLGISVVGKKGKKTSNRQTLLKEELKDLIDTTRMKQIIFTASEAENNLAPSQTVKSFTDEIVRYNSKITTLKTDIVKLNRCQKINKKIDKLIDYIDRIKEKYACTQDINDIVQKNPLWDPNKIFMEAAIKKALNDFERQKRRIEEKGLSSEDEKNALRKLSKEHGEKQIFIEQIVHASEEALAKRKENYQHAYQSSDDLSIAQKELRAVLAKIEGGTLEKGPLTQTADKIFANMSQYTSKEALTNVLCNVYEKKVQNRELAKAIRLNRAIDLFFDRMTFINALGPAEHLSLKANASSSNRVDSNPPSSMPIDTSTQIPAGQIAAEYVNTLLCRYFYDKSARDALSDLGVIKSSQSRTIIPNTITITINDEWQKILVNAGKKEWQKILIDGSSLASGTKATFSHREEMKLPSGLTEYDNNSPVILRHEPPLLPPKATFVNDKSKAKFEMQKNSKGSHDFIMTEPPSLPANNQAKPALSLKSQTGNADSNPILESVHQILQLYVQANGTNAAMEIEGSNIECIKATILLCKANNLEYQIARDVIPRIEKKSSKGVIEEIMPKSLDEVKKLCKKQKMSPEATDLAMKVFEAHCMKPDTAKTQCKANGLAPLLATIVVNDETKKAIASNKPLQTLTDAIVDGTRLNQSTVKSFGQSVQALAAPKSVVVDDNQNMHRLVR